ncbi:MAG TPA: cellulase family glycosylhydrolase [Gaiellaceae bacterium]|nr:cellulase family glycosylhydrolase [Gaiellaceae bacterium]
MLRAARFTLLALTAFLTIGAATASAGPRMPIGFFDDPTFRWSADRMDNLQRASADGASIIHTTATWAAIAPTRPAHAADGDDPAYKLADLDELVQRASAYGLRVMINITGTPKWANGNKKPNVMPKKVADFQTFARMLSTRYNGAHGKGYVGLWSVWNEPNLQQFLTPQYVGKKIVSTTNYGKLYKAAYAGIKSGNRSAQVAIGETSAQGRDKPSKGSSQTVSPGNFAKLLSKVRGLKFDAWAHHPYPTAPFAKPTEKVRYPNVTLSTMPKFEKDLHKWFKRTVPIWITEYGHETKPGERKGVTLATQARYAKQALGIARKDPNVQMFIWFTFRDSSGNPWQSGLLKPSGAAKPSYSAFGSVARQTDGIEVNVKSGRTPTLNLYFPFLSYYDAPGTVIGMTYKVRDGSRLVAVSQPALPLRANQSLSIPLDFKPVKKHTYTVTVDANDPNGHSETKIASLKTI